MNCEHNLVHKYDKHECDGCCAQYILVNDITKEEREWLEQTEESQRQAWLDTHKEETNGNI